MKTICIDFDGVIASYQGWEGADKFGDPVPGVQSALKVLRQEGYRIIIFTTRKVTAALKKYLKDNDITYDYINQAALEQTDGMFGGQEIMGVVSGMVFVMCAIAVIMLIVDLIAGLMGLSRSRRPEKYGFFLGWGIPLLVIGVLGTLMGGIFTPPALVGIVCGVVAPILFIVGGVQQNGLHNQNTSPRF